METGAQRTILDLRRAVAPLLGFRVSATICWDGRTAPTACVTGELEGIVELPMGNQAPMAIVIGGDHITLWPDDLEGGRLDTNEPIPGFLFESPSGAVIGLYPILPLNHDTSVD